MRKKPSKLLRDAMENMVQQEYLGRIRTYAKESFIYKGNIPGFLINPSVIKVLWFEHHFALSFEGGDLDIDDSSCMSPSFIHECHYSDSSDTFLFSALTGFELARGEPGDQQDWAGLAVLSISKKGFLFSGGVMSGLLELGWRPEIMHNSGGVMGFRDPAFPQEKSLNFQNVFVYYGLPGNGFSTRHFQWVEVFPYMIDFDGEGDILRLNFWRPPIRSAVENAGGRSFYIPKEYRDFKFSIINGFVELWAQPSIKEVEITRFFEQKNHKFILTMHFGARDVFAERSCPKLDSPGNFVRPDFFVECANGVCDILEFKLPVINKPFVIGGKNNRRFASWFNCCIAQARTYRDHFSLLEHRCDIKERHGLVVEIPTVTLVIGRAKDITPEVRDLLREHRGINAISYDELIAGAVAQLYL